MYQEFVLELHKGCFLQQLTSVRDCSSVHCQLTEDLQTLKLDQCTGRIVEFPLTGVSKVYRIVKVGERFYSWAASHAVPPGTIEYIVVVEFLRRKLAFVFGEPQASLRFFMCMELLIRQAQQTSRDINPTDSAARPPEGATSSTTPPKAPMAAATDLAGKAPFPQDGSVSGAHVEQTQQVQAPMAPRGKVPCHDA